MDDISLIGPIDVVHKASIETASQYEHIELHLNPRKCFLIGNDFKEFEINNCIILFTIYSHKASRFLGCWLGNVDEITENLEKIAKKLQSISELEIEKHIKFFILKICYSGKITHLLRSTAPSLSNVSRRSFNQLRATFIASLLEVNPELIRAHLFLSSQFGGVGLTKSSILCQAAFAGGCKNFIFEFLNREDSHLLNPFSNFLFDLDIAINKIAPEMWCQCFPDSVQEIPQRNLVN
ncbi:hypothetical protein P9112_008752 [Eukaryota sp. TZLM1-RC]